MCLSSFDLNLSYDEKEKTFVGIGYKAISIYDINGRLNWSMSKFLKPNVWLEASGSFNKKPSKNQKFELSAETNNYKYYWPGFHIFLDVEHAIGYFPHVSLVEVKFKEVTCFGKNLTFDKNNALDGECVIARYAKITKILSKRALDYEKQDDGQYPKPYVIYEE